MFLPESILWYVCWKSLGRVSETYISVTLIWEWSPPDGKQRDSSVIFYLLFFSSLNLKLDDMLEFSREAAATECI